MLWLIESYKNKITWIIQSGVVCKSHKKNTENEDYMLIYWERIYRERKRESTLKLWNCRHIVEPLSRNPPKHERNLSYKIPLNQDYYSKALSKDCFFFPVDSIPPYFFYKIPLIQRSSKVLGPGPNSLLNIYSLSMLTHTFWPRNTILKYWTH